ncbi:amylo-alpha-1,6-glucosidase [Saccharolobus solfataricus]|uniref:Glycogen debranching protein n=1 Tax=Saccharolobus solfataricus TaxID=2287 RepID=A0A0E3MI05_SACSO|nr:amylo-alpha-1,6-glucosidase [Saccharolobus solfataricus]AKA74215.1 glycogen debranching protein [Saccharolobus solfataricus]AKA76913.1 glycogen debranching protein [Saccharolobus solfataricus]AKA79605.1 glycogen debranching protein [Saccharolobus solfataricus]AZF84347.1 glycogen debranching protein [Saccharolobus solfataricus]
MIPLDQCEEEWLLPTRTGGYASSTICGINARTYHGYLIVPLNQPHHRFLILSKFEDFLLINGDTYSMSTNYYPGSYYPDGYKYLIKVEKNSNSKITWHYDFGYSQVEKTLRVHKGYNAITITYIATRGKFKLCPFITFRSHHLAKKLQNEFFTYEIYPPNTIYILYEGKRILNFEIHDKYELFNSGYWYYNFIYKLDQELGNNYIEDLYNPFCIVSTSNKISVTVYYDQRPKDLSVEENEHYDILKLLSAAGKDFVVKGKDGWAIIAGYHLFDEWGRDTFISLEGLLLVDKQYDIAKEIILKYLNLEKRGMLPNNFISYNGEPVYRGVDISLWAINAIYKTYIYSRDKNFIRKVVDKVLDIIDWYSKGNGVIYNVDNLIFHKGAPRTWMDASYDSRIVTPREGAAVEINALWYNALRVTEFLLNELGEKAEYLSEKAESVKKSFAEKFISQDGLYDYINWDNIPDKSIRPNQIFSISLPFPIIDDKSIASKILTLIESKLLRQYGLSSLSREDPNYKPVYKGDRRSRDEAYHNGPIWPWLLGAYVDSKLRLESNIMELKLLLEYFNPLLAHASKNQGYIPEIFDDIPPYKPRGCFAQAWSNAEVYRVLVNLSKL